MSRVNSAYTQLMHMRRIYLSKSVAFLSLDIPFTLHTHPLMGNQHSNMAHKDRQTHHYGRQEEEYHLEIPDMVDDRFKVEGRLGAGSFGVLHEGKLLNHVTRQWDSLVNLGVNVETNQPIAIKLEPGNCRVQQLQDEYKIYRLLGGAGIVFQQQYILFL